MSDGGDSCVFCRIIAGKDENSRLVYQVGLPMQKEAALYKHAKFTNVTDYGKAKSFEPMPRTHPIV
jgi:hypothetical protein